MSSLVQVVYISTAVKPLDVGQLASLLRTAQRHNEDVGITGLLIYSSGQFMQCLEGPLFHVSKLLQKIKLDPRHTQYEELLFEPIEEQAFPGWNMGLLNLDAPVRRLDRGPLKMMTKVLLRRPQAALPSDRAVALLRRFRELLPDTEAA